MFYVLVYFYKSILFLNKIKTKKNKNFKLIFYFTIKNKTK